jgi:spectinomycin phosphotransferase
MLEKPSLTDDAIINRLNQQYRLTVVSLEFLPIGNDAAAWVYKVSAVNAAYLLKVKWGQISLASLDVPHFLYESGIEQVVAPIPNQSHELSTSLQEFTLILYPFIDGQSGMQIGLSLDQWRNLGAILRKMHSTRFPSELVQQVPRESFTLKANWMQIIHSLQQGLSAITIRDELEEKLAVFWQEHTQEIAHIISRTEELGRLLQAQSLPYVLCHADIHIANVLVDGAGHLFIVDWDGTLFAPKERDLMFVVGGREASSPENESERAFMSGYGHADISWLALAYYRYEWVVQEIADFAERVFLMPGIGLETKQDAVRGFKQLFRPGDVITSAYTSESYLA